MRTKSGVLCFTKKEEEAMRIVIRHAKADLDYGWDGSYGGHNTDSKRECAQAEREAEKGRAGIELFERILNTFRKGNGMN